LTVSYKYMKCKHKREEDLLFLPLKASTGMKGYKIGHEQAKAEIIRPLLTTGGVILQPVFNKSK